MISNIQITQRMTLKIGSTDYEITRDAAEVLYKQLGVILGKQKDFELSYPDNVRSLTSKGNE